MNKYQLIPCGLLAGLLTFSSCSDEFLNTQPLGEVSESAVWTDAALAEAFVTEIYAGLEEQMLASLTDEAIFTHPGRNITTVTEARSNPADPGWISGTRSWENMYTRIRASNLAIEKLSDPQFENTDSIAQRLVGEATFMRAYFYHQLLRNYGGFPIIDRTYGLGEDDYGAPRNTYEECVEFIVNDLDNAAALLEGKMLPSGRTNQAAALALKARVLTYAASDLHDIPTASAKSSVIASYSHPELLGYTTGDRASRWQRAKDAAAAVLAVTDGNLLNLSAPVTPEEGVTNYINNSLSRNGGEQEMLFGRYFINAKQEGGGRQGLYNGPNGYNNWAGNTPIQLLVDDYEMMDGTEFNWDNPAHASDPYDNRDPRLAASILHEGSPWKPRSTANQSRDPLGQIQTGTYDIINASGAKDTHFGLDTRNSPIEDWNGSYTGYYVRKFIDPDPAIVDQNTWQEVPWPVLRFTEAVLNYVEASIELGQDAEAREWLNKIRFRVGMPAVTESGDALMERYRNERRIEMAYEEQRFYDVRRWMIAPTTFNRQANGINIVGTFKPGQTLSIYRYDPEIYNYSYAVFNIDPGKENRAWLDKMYWMPIHRDEINRNDNLIQNPGYTE
jgi:hypothetical protein